MSQEIPSTATAVRVERWPTEIPLLVLVACVSLLLWIVFAFSIIGIVYAAIIGFTLFLMQLGFISHVRGSAVRLGPNQFPALYTRVEDLSARLGLPQVPEAYLMQYGGELNALATRFLRSRMIILFSDLIDACGEDTDARDMVIGHELGHIKAGHLNWAWFLAPGFFFPFLGSAYSRAREYTCDRYGAAVCGRREGALRGLAILAAGGKAGPAVNVSAMAQQREHMNTGLMTIGKWLSTHPPVCDRLAALDATLDPGRVLNAGPLRALGILVAVPLTIGLVSAGVATALMASNLSRLFSPRAVAETESPSPAPSPEPVVDSAQTHAQVSADLEALAAAAADHKRRLGAYPADGEALYGFWRSTRPATAQPEDPYDGSKYGYAKSEGGGFELWSSGPDAETGTEDDIRVVRR